MTNSSTPRADVYSRITDKIIADLEQGVRPWMKPWNAEHAASRITKPLRHNGQAYNGINILMLWSAANSGPSNLRISRYLNVSSTFARLP